METSPEAVALEIIKLAAVGAISAWIVSLLTARRFLGEKHWETRFEHYNRVHRGMSQILTHLLNGVRPHIHEKVPFSIEDDSIATPRLADLARELSEASQYAGLVHSGEATRLAKSFVIKVLVTDASETRYLGGWDRIHQELARLQDDYIEVARHDLGFESEPTLAVRLWRRAARRRSSPALRDSSQGDPLEPEAQQESS